MDAIKHLYVHVPFCARECPYCGFYKHKNNRLDQIKNYLEVVPKELAYWKQKFSFHPRTIYFGGGTPSILSVSQLEVFLSYFRWNGVEECTFECNPATLSQEKADLLKKMGVNRISLGAQAFEMYFLRILGRTHRREHVQETMKRLRHAGFDNINIDLMFGLPDQTLEHWEQALREAVALNPRHISAYNLTFEEDTKFFKQREQGLWKNDEKLQSEMFLFAHDFLEQNGFTHYEISNYAQTGYESIHNQAYWNGDDYLGLGPSGYSTLGNRRLENIADTDAYIDFLQKNKIPRYAEEILSDQTKLFEKIFLGLRTRQGVEFDLLAPWKKQVEDLIRNQFAILRNERLMLTSQGFLLADEISKIFA